MKKAILIVFLISLLLLASCVKKEVIVSQGEPENGGEEVIEEKPDIIAVEEVTLPESYKCSGAVFYFKDCILRPDGGADLRIVSYAKKSYDSFWFILHFPDGSQKFHGFSLKVNSGDDIVTGFDFDLQGLREKYGDFNKVELDPQMMNELGQPVICRNLRVVFNPDVNCR